MNTEGIGLWEEYSNVSITRIRDCFTKIIRRSREEKKGGCDENNFVLQCALSPFFTSYGTPDTIPSFLWTFPIWVCRCCCFCDRCVDISLGLCFITWSISIRSLDYWGSISFLSFVWACTILNDLHSLGLSIHWINREGMFHIIVAFSKTQNFRSTEHAPDLYPDGKDARNMPIRRTFFRGLILQCPQFIREFLHRGTSCSHQIVSDHVRARFKQVLTLSYLLALAEDSQTVQINQADDCEIIFLYLRAAFRDSIYCISHERVRIVMDKASEYTWEDTLEWNIAFFYGCIRCLLSSRFL